MTRNWLWRNILGAIIAALLGLALALIVHATRAEIAETAASELTANEVT